MVYAPEESRDGATCLACGIGITHGLNHVCRHRGGAATALIHAKEHPLFLEFLRQKFSLDFAAWRITAGKRTSAVAMLPEEAVLCGHTHDTGRMCVRLPGHHLRHHDDDDVHWDDR